MARLAWTGPSGRASGTAALIASGVLLLATTVPGIARVRDGEARAAVQANLLIVQGGVERYARDHGGLYPTGLRDGSMRWSSYMPPALPNPFNDRALGLANILADFASRDPAPMAARRFQLTGPPGKICYFVDATRRTYALVAFDEHGRLVRDPKMPEATLVTHN